MGLSHLHDQKRQNGLPVCRWNLNPTDITSQQWKYSWRRLVPFCAVIFVGLVDLAAAQTSTPNQAPETVHRWTNSLGMKFNSVPGTKVLFGIWDVRVKDYSVFAKETKQEWPKPNFVQTENDPAVMVSWNDAIAFCDWLTKKEHATGKLSQNKVYRLPTDAEWTAAAGKGKFPWGDTWPPPPETVNYNKNLTHDKYPRTSPVGSFPANQYGLYDMAGNVYQWCMDWYQASMNSTELRQKLKFLDDDKGGEAKKVLRGSAWDRGWDWGGPHWREDLFDFMSSSRFFWEPTYRGDCFGFRVVVALAEPIPEGYTVPSETRSPSQRYGFTVPKADTHQFDVYTGHKIQISNSLFDLKTGKVITVVDAWTAYKRMNHGGIIPPWWSGDESIVLWNVSGKWCPWALVLIKFKDDKMVWQLNVLTTFQKEILARTKAVAPKKYEISQKHNAGNGIAFPDGFTVNVEVATDAGSNSKDRSPLKLPLKIHATLTANPKGIEGSPNLNSEMNGIANEDGTITVTDFKLL